MSDERKHKKMSEEWIVFTEDVLFWLIAAITEILAVYHINRGEIRIYCLMISVSGFFIYQRTFGKVFLFLSTKILYLLRYVFYGICCLVLSPSLFLWKILKRIGAYCKKHWKKHQVKNLFWLTKERMFHFWKDQNYGLKSCFLVRSAWLQFMRSLCRCNWELW